jgi:HD superfamily phosphodiesterase
VDPVGFDPLAYSLEPEWFERPGSIHGISHTRRVLIHAQQIAAARDLDPEWFESVVLAVAWHDIGRTHDGREPEHGANSVAKVRRLGLDRGVDQQVLARTLFAMEWHSVSDYLAVDAAAALQPGHRPEPGTMLRVLWLLKDADGLDRVRIYDLDPEQLRYEESVKLVDRARQLLRDMP